MRTGAAIAFLVAATALGAQVPSTDIYLAPLTVFGSAVKIGSPVDVTNRPGYDNQPSFTPDGRSILFTSIHDDGQSDIYRYDLSTKKIVRVTDTPESEYSATVVPGGKRFSVIRVEKDSAQRLWSFALNGSDPQLVLPEVRPVGYHVWINDHELALFVLSRPANLLVHADTRTGHADTVASGIGRSLVRRPGGLGYTYVQQHDSTSTLMSVMASGTVALTQLPPKAQDVVWLNSSLLLASSGTKIYSWGTADKTWREVIDLSSAHLHDVTRMAVSPDGASLAIVAGDGR